MSQTLPKIIADFNTTITASVAVGDTTFTLTSATDDDGVALPTGTYGLTIDRKNSNKEYIQCTITGTAVTNVKNVSRQGALTVGFARKHRKGAEVIISDFSVLKKMLDLLDSTTDFDSGTPLSYDGAPTFTPGSNEIATVKYADDLAIAGSPDATISTKGISKMSVAPVSTSSPISVGDNDPRVPTQSENDAMVGTSGTPSSTNKFVTNDDTATAATANKVARRLAGGNITVVTESANNNTTNAASTEYVDTAISSAGLSSLPYFLGTGDGTSNKSYWNYSIPFISGTAALWTASNVSTSTSLVNQLQITGLTSSANNVSYKALIYSANSLATQLSFGTQALVVEFISSCTSVGTDDMTWGIGVSGSFTTVYNSAANDRACFTVDKTTSKLYAHTSGGGGTTDHTEVEITGITLTNANTYRIEYNPGVNTKFYVNGVLKSTITTTLPNSGGIEIGFGGTYHGSGSMTDYPNKFTAPYVAVAKS